MKIKITLSMDVDPEQWSLIYGIDRDCVREDVRDYVLNQVSQSTGVLESGADVRLS